MQGLTSNLSELNSKAWALRYTDREEAGRLAKEIKATAQEKDPVNVAYATITLAQLEFWKTSSGEQLSEILRTVPVFKKVKETLGASRAHAVAASIYEQFGEYEKALQQALLSVKIAELGKDEANRGECYTVLGQVYSRIHDHEKAIEALKKGLEIRQELKDDKAVASSLNLIARNYVLSKKYEEGEKYYKESLTLRQNTGDTAGIPWTYIGIASLYSHKGEWKRSLEQYEKAEAANSAKEKRFELLCLIGKGKIYAELSETAKAIATLQEALTNADALKIISLQAEAHQLLSLAHQQAGEFEKALEHYKRFDTLNQEILSNDKLNTLKNQQVAFSVEKAEQEAEIHRLRNVELKEAFDKIAAQHHELEEKNKEITDSISYAKRIQDAYLPPRELFNIVLPKAFLLFKPKDIVSGDFYWFHEVESSKLKVQSSLLFAAADCTGHGVPGAIMSVICCNALNEVVKKKNVLQPDLILNEVRDVVTSAFKKEGNVTQKDGMDIALVRLIPNKTGVTLQFAGANNPLWVIKGRGTGDGGQWTRDGGQQLIEIKADKQPIGQYEVMSPFTLHELELQKGDTIYSFSDGYADQFGGEHGKKFKYKPLKDLLLSIQDKSMPEQHNILVKAFDDWKKEHEQIDDVCMIGVRV